MILITNEQPIMLNIQSLRNTAQKILDLLGYPDFDLGILLTDDKTIQEYNRTYRKKDEPTDILSFPYHPDLTPGQRIVTQTDDDKNLGDLIVSPEYVKRNAHKHDIPFDQHMTKILVHGICHLLGYDHITDEDYEIMHAKEQEIFKNL